MTDCCYRGVHLYTTVRPFAVVELYSVDHSLVDLLYSVEGDIFEELIFQRVVYAFGLWIILWIARLGHAYEYPVLL